MKSLHGSGLITAEDREFLLHHWDRTVSSTRDSVTKIQAEKKLARNESYQKYSSIHSTPLFFTFPGPSVGTAVNMFKDFLEKLGLAADRPTILV